MQKVKATKLMKTDYIILALKYKTKAIVYHVMQNIKITVTTTESAIDNDDSLCVYRDGAPAAGENRPEVFTCTSSMIGRYVKVSMVDVEPAPNSFV
ncbi:hypothetical protein EB796_022386 [Bugula neritina]|uniref:Uncharacterized protein n=1 Tax=Bugula neritina TaxID=10212 RepID=A0A7J7J0E4_BUGNE|nr:hypothetical protein EB796_022386 [Bugula neritina]